MLGILASQLDRTTVNINHRHMAARGQKRCTNANRSVPAAYVKHCRSIRNVHSLN
ncbi:hypothetical protein D3C71_2051340 [compost metagenome]